MSGIELWLVLVCLFAYWVFLVVRAVLWRAVPWYFKIVSLVAYPLAMCALVFPRYEYVLGLPAIALIFVGFALDALWRHTTWLGSFDDPGRRSRSGRHRSRP